MELEIKGATMFMDFARGALSGADVVTSQKRYADAQGFYEKVDPTLPGDTLMYEVSSMSAPDARAGALNWGLTDLKPVRVCGECNMTRGHFHESLDCDEVYFTLAGRGLLLLMDEDGACWAEEMKPGSVHYIDGHTAHRTINTGETDLRFGACWPAVSGHDYARVERQPFPVRVFAAEDGSVEVRPA